MMLSLFSDLEVDSLTFFTFVLAFCNPNTTCNGQGTCGNDGHCQCLDGLFGENCSGNLTNCMSFPFKPCFRVYRNDFFQSFQKEGIWSDIFSTLSCSLWQSSEASILP